MPTDKREIKFLRARSLWALLGLTLAFSILSVLYLRYAGLSPHRAREATGLQRAYIDNTSLGVETQTALRLATRLRPPPHPKRGYGSLFPLSLPLSQARLTILQIGDSHTAADFFSGHMREELRRSFGDGGVVLLPPGLPHAGVLSAMFEISASGDWSYETSLFHLSGFKALAQKAGAEMIFTARDKRPYDGAEIAFLTDPHGGKARIFLDDIAVGDVALEGSGRELIFTAKRPDGQGFRTLKVQTLDAAEVILTGATAMREGAGVSYLSTGYPGASVQLLQKFDPDTFTQDINRLAPDILVLAFGTNEGFNDDLDIKAYSAQYRNILNRLQAMRPGMKIILIGPPDAARHKLGGGACHLAAPPKLDRVREAQRKLSRDMGLLFWDWRGAQGGACPAQSWAAAKPALMGHDYVHMTPEGYRKSADSFADFLVPLVKAYHVFSDR